MVGWSTGSSKCRWNCSGCCDSWKFVEETSRTFWWHQSPQRWVRFLNIYFLFFDVTIYHPDYWFSITCITERFREVAALGNQLLVHNPGQSEIKDRLDKLSTEQTAVERGLEEKGDWLRQCLDLQCFNQEADHIDTMTAIHEAFLDFTDLGVSLVLSGVFFLLTILM